MTSETTRQRRTRLRRAGDPARVPPPAGVVSFLQRVFDFAETLDPREGRALRRLVRAGLLADDGTIDAILNDDVAGYRDATLLIAGCTRPVWYWQ